MRPEDWEFSCDSDQSGNTEENNNRRSQMGLLARLGFAPITWGSKASAVQFDKTQTMTPKARAAVDLVSGGTPVCNAGMDDLHPDMSSAAAEIYLSSIALAESRHTIPFYESAPISAGMGRRTQNSWGTKPDGLKGGLQVYSTLKTISG